jgi:hypothetical protein
VLDVCQAGVRVGRNYYICEKNFWLLGQADPHPRVTYMPSFYIHRVKFSRMAQQHPFIQILVPCHQWFSLALIEFFCLSVNLVEIFSFNTFSIRYITSLYLFSNAIMCEVIVFVSYHVRSHCICYHC